MHTGAVLRELEQRKHEETAHVARALVPKLEAADKRHKAEMAQLNVLRLTCTDDDAINRVDEATAEKKTAHQVALKEIEAEVCEPLLPLTCHTVPCPTPGRRASPCTQAPRHQSQSRN